MKTIFYLILQKMDQDLNGSSPTNIELSDKRLYNNNKMSAPASVNNHHNNNNNINNSSNGSSNGKTELTNGAKHEVNFGLL